MNKQKSTIETFLPCFPGFYESILSPGETQEIDGINDIREEKGLPEINYDDCEWNYEEYHERVSKRCVEVIEKKVNEILETELSFEYQSSYSPREYNFSTDSVNISIKISDNNLGAIASYVVKNVTAFKEYLLKYKSCSGFISSYAYDLNTWMNEYWLDIKTNKHYLGSILEFVLENEGFESEDLYYGCDDSLYISAENYDDLTAPKIDTEITAIAQNVSLTALRNKIIAMEKEFNKDSENAELYCTIEACTNILKQKELLTKDQK